MSALPRRSTDHARGRADDAAIVAAVAHGDQGAVADLYDRHGALAWSIAMQVVRDEQVAREVVQDAFVAIWRRAGEYDPMRAAVATWVARITRARAIDRLRHDGAARRAPQAGIAALDSVGEHAGSDDVEAQAAASERATMVRGVLDELPREQRVLVELTFLHGYTHAELAHHLQLPIGTVKTRIFRGVARLRELLESRLAEEAR